MRGNAIIERERLHFADNRCGFLYLFVALLNYPLLFIAIACLPALWRIPVCFILAIRLFNCLAQVTHGCGHRTLFRDERLNYLVGSLTSFLMFYHPRGMWTTHSDHHAYLNTLRDGDRIWWLPKGELLQIVKWAAFDLTGGQALRRALLYYKQMGRRATGRSRSLRHLIPSTIAIAAIQGALYPLFLVVGGRSAYFLYYLLPLASLYPAQARLRSFVEHHGNWAEAPSSGGWEARSSAPTLAERFVLAPFEQCFHLEHHLFPQVPAYRLRRLHQMLCAELSFPRPSHGYFAWLSQATGRNLKLAGSETP